MSSDALKRAFATGDSEAFARAVRAARQASIEAFLDELAKGTDDPTAALRKALDLNHRFALPLRWVPAPKWQPQPPRAPEKIDASLDDLFPYLLKGGAAILVGSRALPITVPPRVKKLFTVEAAERVLPIAEAYHKGNPWPRRAVEAARAGDARKAATASFEIGTHLLSDEVRYEAEPRVTHATIACKNAADSLRSDRTSHEHAILAADDAEAERKWLWERLRDLLLASLEPIGG